MKKLFVFVLCIVYLASSAGAGLQLHYCMGKLAGWDLGAPASNHCQHCGMEKKAGKQHCCHDEQKWIKGATDQTANEASIQLFIPLLHAVSNVNIVRTYAFIPVRRTSYPSPFTFPPKLFLLHRVFRI